MAAKSNAKIQPEERAERLLFDSTRVENNPRWAIPLQNLEKIQGKIIASCSRLFRGCNLLGFSQQAYVFSDSQTNTGAIVVRLSINFQYRVSDKRLREGLEQFLLDGIEQLPADEIQPVRMAE